MVPTVVVVGALGAGIANGAVPVSFAVSGSSFKVTASELDGTNFVQYGSVAVEKGGTQHIVAESGISSADLTKLCQSVEVPSTPLFLELTAGDDGTPAHAENLIIDMSQLSGDATFTNINIGQDASTLNDGSTSKVKDQTISHTGSNGQAGGFGQRADLVKIMGLSQTAYATSAGTFTLPHLSLSFTTHSC
jgi:hypothetical protein